MKISRHVGGKHGFHLQGSRVNQVINQIEAGSKIALEPFF
jgi:hypothetical protein